MEMILAGLMDSLSPVSLIYVFVGVAVGVAIGAIPGINGPMAIALFIPLTYYMSPLAAIGFLVGLNGTSPAELIEMPCVCRDLGRFRVSGLWQHLERGRR